MMQFEIVLTGHTRWWLHLLNWLGADMKWTHALLRYCEVGDGSGWIIEACNLGVVRRRWNPSEFESYGRFKLKDDLFASEKDQEFAYQHMLAFAMGEIGKRYKYEALGPIAARILRRIFAQGLRIVQEIFGVPLNAEFIGVGEVCTSLVDRTLQFEGFDLVSNEDSPYILPDEIAASELLEVIEEVRK